MKKLEDKKENFLKKYPEIINCALLAIGLLISFIFGKVIKKTEIKSVLIILVLSILLYILLLYIFLKNNFNPEKNFENKCKSFGCEFLIFYSKEKNLKNKYEKLLPILESWKLGYYGVLLPVYVGVGSLLIIDNRLKNRFEESFYYYGLYLLIVAVWMLSRVFIHKILLIEKALQYKSRFSDEVVPKCSEIFLSGLIIFLGMFNAFRQGEEFELIMQGKEVVANFEEIFIKLIELV